MTPIQWYNMTVGKKYDIDGYYGYQCWDYFAYFCRYFNLSMVTHCSLTGYAGDIWKLRLNNGALKYFQFIYNVNELRDGDWCFWDRHVAMYYKGMEVGQNQNGNPAVSSIRFIPEGFLGAFRYINWTKQEAIKGVAECYTGVFDKTYTATANLNLRTGGSIGYAIITTIPQGGKVRCYGYYHYDNGTIWLYVTTTVNGKSYTGFCCKNYLR